MEIDIAKEFNKKKDKWIIVEPKRTALNLITINNKFIRE